VRRLQQRMWLVKDFKIKSEINKNAPKQYCLKENDYLFLKKSEQITFCLYLIKNITAKRN